MAKATCTPDKEYTVHDSNYLGFLKIWLSEGNCLIERACANGSHLLNSMRAWQDSFAQLTLPLLQELRDVHSEPEEARLLLLSFKRSGALK